VTMMRACGFSRRARRIACRACRTALAGNGARVYQDGIVEPGRFRLGSHHFGFVGIEPAAEGDDFDTAHRARASGSASREKAPVEGSTMPDHSHSAGPVMTTWSSRSRHSMLSLPAGLAVATSMVTFRAVRPVRAALTAAAQEAEPQASVSPCPTLPGADPQR